MKYSSLLLPLACAAAAALTSLIVLLAAPTHTRTYYLEGHDEPWCYVHYVTRDGGFEEIQFPCVQRPHVPAPVGPM